MGELSGGAELAHSDATLAMGSPQASHPGRRRDFCCAPCSQQLLSATA